MTLVEYGLAALLCEDPQPVNTSSICAVYRTMHDGQSALLKIPRVREEQGGEHVWRETRALRGLSGILSLPKLYKSWELQQEKSVAALAHFLYGERVAFGLLREYLEGCTLGTAIARGSYIDYEGLGEDVRAIHEQGYASLDIHVDNLLVDAKGTLHLIDLGTSVHHDDGPVNAFISWKSFDHTCLRKILFHSAARERYT